MANMELQMLQSHLSFDAKTCKYCSDVHDLDRLHRNPLGKWNLETHIRRFWSSAAYPGCTLPGIDGFEFLPL